MSIHTNQASTVYFWITPACSTLFQSTLFCCTMGASWSNQTCPVIPEISVVPISMCSSALSPLCRQYHTLHYKSTAKAQSLTFPRACHQSWLPQDHTWVVFIWWITALFYCLSPWLSSLTSYSWNNFIVDNLCILLLINIQSNFFFIFSFVSQLIAEFEFEHTMLKRQWLTLDFRSHIRSFIWKTS